MSESGYRKHRNDGPPSTTECGQAPLEADLELGRKWYEQRAWASAYQALSRADTSGSLGSDDLERLAVSAYFIGRDDQYLEGLQRAYQAHVAAGAAANAARTAFWIGLRLLFKGEVGHANGWLGRAQRLLERQQNECVEQGYLLIAVSQLHVGAGDFDAAYAAAASADKIGERFNESDLIATARHLLGRIRLQQGKIQEGLSLLDEVMVAATGGELSPLVTGLLYCSVIEGCQEVFALGRAREWTAALAKWCEAQPEMVAFAGICSVHRAEILQQRGAWSQALAEAKRAATRCLDASQKTVGAACYVQGEVHRLRGEIAAAEDAYRAASQSGWEPQPGLSLLRLAQGRTKAAVASIRRLVGATSDPSRRATLLPAYIEIMVAGDDVESAENACRELGQLADQFGSGVLRAMAQQGAGAVQLAAGNPSAALAALRSACQAWQELDVPHMGARVRVLMGRCCQALGDEEGGKLELSAARIAFERLGATADLALLDSGAAAALPAGGGVLTTRELEVLRLLVAGKTNKEIAATLSLSEKTVERHVSNIFTKLDVPSRTAATAYAYEHRLI